MCHCANVKALCEAIDCAEEAPLHRQSQRSVHNSNSCSCILIRSSGLSLKGSIFLHFRNYGLAREFGLKNQEAEAAPAPSSPPPPQRLPSKLANNCARLSHPVRRVRFLARPRRKKRGLCSRFHLQQVRSTKSSFSARSLPGDRGMNSVRKRQH